MIKRTPRKHMSSAIMRVMRTSPFYTVFIIKHKIIEDRNVNGIEIDGETLKYHPEGIMHLSVPELAESLKHCAMHIAHKHHIRGATVKPRMESACKAAGVPFERVFNEAADLSINSLLRKNNEQVWSSENMNGAALPGKDRYSEIEDGKAMEDYCSPVLEILEQEPKEEQPGNGDGNGSSGNGQSGSGGQGGGEQSNDDDSPGNDENKNEDDQQKDSDNQQQDNQKPETKPQDMNFGMVAPTPNKNVRAEENKTDEMIAEAVMAAKAGGEGTGTVKDFILEYDKPPKVNWRQELSQFFEQTCRGRPNFRHVNRRLFGRDFIFPSNKDKSPKKTILLVDVSGSMSDECVASVYAHIEAIISIKREMEIVLVPFDGKVFEDKIKSFDSTNVPIPKQDKSRAGFGGTAFMPPVKYAEEQENVSGIIMLTDRLPFDKEPFEKHKTQFPWLILSVLEHQFGDRYCGSAVNPKWARVLEVEP